MFIAPFAGRIYAAVSGVYNVFMLIRFGNSKEWGQTSEIKMVRQCVRETADEDLLPLTG